MNNIEKGVIYEKFIRNYLETENNENIAWLWKYIPEKDLRKANLLGDWNKHRLKKKELKNLNHEEDKLNDLMDTGCDILLYQKNNDKYIIVQCKNYAEKNRVKMEDLAGFFMNLLYTNLDGIVYYTSKLSHVLLDQKQIDKIKYIKKLMIEENIIEPKFVEKTNLLEHGFDYQIEAYQALHNAFLTKNRAILQLPCGLGKTLISMMIAVEYKQIIILSPLKQYVVQNLDRYKSELKFNEYKSLIIDSDETRDLEFISEFIDKSDKFILSVCYKSTDILNQVLDKLNDYIIIIDEFHNITQNDILGLKENSMNKILTSDSKILFMSATPRIFELEDEDLNDDIFGIVEYSYNMGDAIKNNKICDYEVYIPNIELNNNEFIDNIKEEIDIHSLQNEILIKSNFLLRAMLETGAQKTILYARTQDEAHEFKIVLETINEYFSLDLYVDTILSQDNKNSRQTKLDKFRNFEGFGIMINVEILNECIDIKECDSVYITYPSTSKIRNIQRVCRSNRKDINNVNKVSKIFIWSNEYEEITEIIKHLKEFDNSFMIEKIKILSINNNDYQILDREIHKKNYILLDSFILNIRRVEAWEEKFENLIKYLNENKQIPSANNKDEKIHLLAVFWQKQNYAYQHKIKMMRHKKYYDTWKKFKKEYPEYFEDHSSKWQNRLKEVGEFIKQNNKSPSRYSKNEYEKDLGNWFSQQKTNYKNSLKLLAHEEIKYIWLKFNDEHKKIIMSNEEVWFDKLEKVKNYVIEYGKTPPHKKGEKDSLGLWIITQNKNYAAKTQIMKNPEFYEIWTQFLQENNKSFKTNEEECLKI